MKIIARIYTDFKEKFGIPRQSGISTGEGRIVFEPEYRVREALTGLDGYSHLWLIWQFSEAQREGWSPTVRPPRLGGNKRVGVFATRSPYRPNPIGLSSVMIKDISYTEEGPVITVVGADILDGTPIYDIKPYLAYTDSHPDARGGFSDGVREYALEVRIPDEELKKLDTGLCSELYSVLEHDPRPSYQDDPEREYGMLFSHYEVFFKVDGAVLTVTRIEYR
ncbi:MAG: tRNA (N6-threonylcarbamoyladenosine(37)-N6)-methyltransferase TrmO [Clostridia bacterium]|nr:tRNA (N6-threonylcarbamoyladenosine(37)-N6)-methyltransferase TrmO [Clostridia bacterium]